MPVVEMGWNSFRLRWNSVTQSVYKGVWRDAMRLVSGRDLQPCSACNKIEGKRDSERENEPARSRRAAHLMQPTCSAALFVKQAAAASAAKGPFSSPLCHRLHREVGPKTSLASDKMLLTPALHFDPLFLAFSAIIILYCPAHSLPFALTHSSLLLTHISAGALVAFAVSPAPHSWRPNETPLLLSL